MNVFVQGMRRSGTTVVFDVFREDARFDCYYEPLANAMRESIGGGSGAHSEDFFLKVRDVRERFMQERWPLDDPDLLNHGAPRDGAVEIETTVPDYICEYIRFMCDQAENTMIKFTRMGCKVGALREIDPTAHFIHIVRDPKAVATSYMYRRDQRRRHEFSDKEVFFQRDQKKTPWASHAISNALLKLPEYSHLGPLREFEQILLVWKHVAESTRATGPACFGDRYYLHRHEDLLANTGLAVRSLYESLMLEVPASVRSWADEHLGGVNRVHDVDNPAWDEAFLKLGMVDLLSELGYGAAVEPPPPDRGRLKQSEGAGVTARIRARLRRLGSSRA